MKVDTLDIWQKYNDSSNTKIVSKFRMAKYSPDSPEVPIETSDNHLSTSLNVSDVQPLNDDNNDDDKGGNCLFDIGDYLRNKKAIIVPQNKKDDPFCLLWPTTIAVFKPEKDAGRITKVLREQRVLILKELTFPRERMIRLVF